MKSFLSFSAVAFIFLMSGLVAAESRSVHTSAEFLAGLTIKASPTPALDADIKFHFPLGDESLHWVLGPGILSSPIGPGISSVRMMCGVIFARYVTLAVGLGVGLSAGEFGLAILPELALTIPTEVRVSPTVKLLPVSFVGTSVRIDVAILSGVVIRL